MQRIKPMYFLLRNEIADFSDWNAMWQCLKLRERSRWTSYYHNFKLVSCREFNFVVWVWAWLSRIVCARVFLISSSIRISILVLIIYISFTVKFWFIWFCVSMWEYITLWYFDWIRDKFLWMCRWSIIQRIWLNHATVWREEKKSIKFNDWNGRKAWVIIRWLFWFVTLMFGPNWTHHVMFNIAVMMPKIELVH